MTYRKAKQRLFEILQNAHNGDRASKAFEVGIIGLIIINVIVVIADTFTVPPQVRSIFSYIEIFSVVVFTLEYAARLYTADLLYKNMPPPKARIRYIFSFMAIIDLLAILPFYLPFMIKIDLRVLRMIRMIRLLRILKVNRYTNALSSIKNVLIRKKPQLLSSIFVVVMLMIIASVLMYSVENGAQPEAFSNAFSALWWAVATLTTVGYGDIYPITVAGKILSAIIALLGIGLVAVPTGIISAGFMEQINDKDGEEENDKKHFCPYCGKKLDT